MHRILLIVLLCFVALAGLAPVQAQSDLLLKPCLSLYGEPETVTLTPEIIRRVWFEVEGADATPFLDLEAQAQIVFLGYAPKERRYEEWFGVNYGWQDINILQWWDTGLLEFHDKDGQLVARAEIREYPPDDAYLIYITTLNAYADEHGEHYDYHVPEHPSGGICAFVVDEWDFWVALGWEYE
jgi:hypothetical protein